MATQEGAAESSPTTGLDLPEALAQVAAPIFKFKYKEANPAPADADPSLWNKCFTAADSRLYNSYGKKAERSQRARASGETRRLALQLYAERVDKAALPTLGLTISSTPPIKKNPTASTSAIFSPNDLNDPSTFSTTLPSHPPNSQKATIFQMERSTSRDATPAPFVFGASPSDKSKADFTYTADPPTIADKVKGRGRPAKGQDATASSASAPPLRGFGPTSYGYAEKRKRDDPEEPELTDEQKTKWVDEKLGNMTLAEMLELQKNLVKEGLIPASIIEETMAALKSKTESMMATPPAADQERKPSKAKKKREGRKRAAAARKAAEELPDSPRSPVSACSESSSNDGGQYCICRRPDNHRKMIACDACDEWFHCSCVGVKDEDVDLIDKYICLSCAEPKKNTTWKPMCRLKGCRKPCNLAANPPSKYCSDEHRFQWGRDMVAKMPDGPGPSRGGALTKGELKAMLDHCKGDVKMFHNLGKKPTLPEGSEAINLEAFLTSDEKGRLARISTTREKFHVAEQGFIKRGELLRMVTSRMRKEIDANKDLIGICGWDPLLEKNEEELEEWRDSEDGQRVLQSGVLEGPYCDRKPCKTHPAWIKNVSIDLNEELARLKKLLDKLQVEEAGIHERCRIRAATQNQ